MVSVTNDTINKKSFSKKKKRPSRRSGKLKKQEKIRRLILNYGKKGHGISFKQIAEKVECTENYAKITVARLVKAGKVVKTKTQFLSTKYAKIRVLSGKNIYTPPIKPEQSYEQKDASFEQKSTENSTKKINPKPRISSKEEIAKGQALRNSSKKEENSQEGGNKGKLDLLKSFGFEKFVEGSPDWWFRDIPKLKKALRLLRSKLKKNFKCKNFFKFISFLMKRGSFGFRRHIARNLSLAIVKPNLENVLEFLENEPRRETYEGLVEFYKKQDLQVDFTSIQKLMRNKFPRLTAAVRVCHKRLLWARGEKINNINGFLNYLVGMPNPHDYLKRKVAQ